MKKLFFVISFAFLFISCDYFNTYSLKNKSGEELIVEISVNQKYINPKKVEESMLSNINSKKVVFSDTIHHILQLKLDHDEEFILGAATNGSPIFDQYKKIVVYKNDSLVFYGNQYIIQNLYTNSNQDHTEIVNIY